MNLLYVLVIFTFTITGVVSYVLSTRDIVGNNTGHKDWVKDPYHPLKIHARSKNPLHPNECEVKVGKGMRYYPNGIHDIKNHCKMIECNADFSALIHNCGIVDIPEFCEITNKNFDLPWPDCCPEMLCNEDPENNVTSLEED